MQTRFIVAGVLVLQKYYKSDFIMECDNNEIYINHPDTLTKKDKERLLFMGWVKTRSIWKADVKDTSSLDSIHYKIGCR